MLYSLLMLCNAVIRSQTVSDRFCHPQKEIARGSKRGAICHDPSYLYIPNLHKLQNFPVQESLPPQGTIIMEQMALPQPLKCRQDQISSTQVGVLPPGIDTTIQCGKENQTISHLLTCEKTGTTCIMDDLLQCNSNAKKNHNGLVQHHLAQNGLEEDAVITIDCISFSIYVVRKIPSCLD